MIPYNFNYRIADIDMAKGRNKKGEEYDRKFGAKNGMAELVNIVAGLQKDVKRINDCLTLNGARAYAAKKGPNWQAHEADITGPHGKPDGFKEVFVTDANGNIKVINGYTLAKTTYPERKAYWTVQPTEQRINPETNAPYADRDGVPIEFRMPFSKFRKQLYEISPNVNENGAPYYLRNFNDVADGEQFANIRRGIKPKDAFKAVIFDPVYDANREQIKAIDAPAMMKAQLANKALNQTYKDIIVDSVLRQMFNVQFVSAIDAKAKRKALKSAEFLNKAQAEFSAIATNAEELDKARVYVNDTIQQLIASILHGVSVAPELSALPGSGQQDRFVHRRHRFCFGYGRKQTDKQIQQIGAAHSNERIRIKIRLQSQSKACEDLHGKRRRSADRDTFGTPRVHQLFGRVQLLAVGKRAERSDGRSRRDVV